MEQSEVEKITKLVIEALEKKTTKGYAVPIGVSARHVHLSQADVETLFGKGYPL